LVNLFISKLYGKYELINWEQSACNKILLNTAVASLLVRSCFSATYV